VVIETTGLADPAPVLHTLMAEPALIPHFRLDAVVTTVDAVNGAGTLECHAEAVKQIGMADRLLITKSDLVGAGDEERLVQLLRRLNPGARLMRVLNGEVRPADVLDAGCWSAADMAHGLAAPEDEHGHHHAHDHAGHDPNRHSEHVRSHAFVFDTAVDEADFSHWLELMAAMRGEQLLRVKGLVQTRERPDEPFVVHGVQHLFHPPHRLPAWPSADRRSRLVFIVRDIERAEIERTFQRFVQPLRTM
jgi:G3E family GTPase